MCFGSLLGGKQGGPGTALHLFRLVMQYLAEKTLEWSLTDEQFRRLLVAADLAKGDGAGAVAVGLLHAGGGGGPAGRPGGDGGLALLGGELLLGGLASGGFTCCLFRSGHDDGIVVRP